MSDGNTERETEKIETQRQTDRKLETKKQGDRVLERQQDRETER